MTPTPPATRLTAYVLHAALSRDRAQAILGDVAEELAGRRTRGRPPRWPRLWCEARAILYLLAELRATTPASVRAAAHVVRDSLRALRSAPATTGFVLLILTLGISAATITFSVVDTVVLRRLPFPKSDDLVVLRMGDADGATFSTQEYLAWRDRPDVFAGVAAYTGAWTQELAPASAGDPGGGSVVTASVTPSLFEVLQVAPISGRWLTPDDVQPGREAVTVIGEPLATRLYGDARTSVGRSLRTSSASLTIVGVMPASFGFPLDVEAPVQAWLPLDVTSQRYSTAGGLSRYFRLVARLRPDVPPERVRTALDVASEPLRQAFPRASANWPPRLTPLYDALVRLDLEIPQDRWFTNLATKGNTGSASIFIILDELLSSCQLRPGQRVLCLVPESARMTFAFVHLTAA